MKTTSRAVFASFVLLLGQTTPLWAAGTTSAAFLRLGSGARASAMGEAFTSVADDASATYWNPAGMSRLEKRELMAEHTMHVQDISVERLSYVHPLSNSGSYNENLTQSRAIGLSAAYLHLDGIEARAGNTAQPDRIFGASDLLLSLSYALPLSHQKRRASSLGVTGKFIQQRIDSHSAKAYAVDVGLMQQWGPLHLGLVAANVGTYVRFIDESYALPQLWRLGASLDPGWIPASLAVGVEQVKGESAPAFRFGLEYGSSRFLSLRMGYLSRPSSTQSALKGADLGTVSNREITSFTGFVGGVGFRLFRYGVDYAFTPFGELGSAHKISLSTQF